MVVLLTRGREQKVTTPEVAYDAISDDNFSDRCFFLPLLLLVAASHILSLIAQIICTRICTRKEMDDTPNPF